MMTIRILPAAVLMTLGLLSGIVLSTCDQGDTSGNGPAGDAFGEVPKCASFRLLSGETKQPSVVKLYFQLKTCDGVPVAGLKPEDFIIMEDGNEVSLYESEKKTITDPKSFKLATVLIVDMSGSILASGNLPSLQQAASSFVSTVGAGQSTAVFTFDGREDLQLLVDFTEDVSSLKAGIASLSDYEVVDKSTNLNGAIIEGLEVLDSLRSQNEQSGVLFAGSLAVFTDGTDQAGRVGDSQASGAAGKGSHAVFSIGLGGEVDQSHLKALGKDGAYFADDVDALEATFEEAATDIEAMAKSYYILAYCSPKRAGSHTLELIMEGSSGALEYPFNASGFEGGCSPDDFLTDPSTCVPDCKDKSCDTDGCGGTCGTCSAGLSCQGGTCVEGDTEGTWTDPTSGLTWQVTPTGGTMNWDDAKSHCSNLPMAGGGWHLPTISELRSLIRGCPETVTNGACQVTDSCSSSDCWDQGDCWSCSGGNGPGQDGMYWPDEIEGDCCWYWSSSPVEDADDVAWPVDFLDGDVGYDGVVYDGHVRCVR